MRRIKPLFHLRGVLKTPKTTLSPPRWRGPALKRGETPRRCLALLCLLIILLLSLFGVKALFHQGFYTSHDGEHQVIRLYQFHQALVDGQIPPRWAGTLLNGFGYPLFVFTYQLPFFIAEIFYLIGFSLTDSIKIVFILSFILSEVVMFFWQKDLWGKFPALIASLIFLWAPYRFLNIFVRAALGEAVTFLFFPLIFYAIFKLKKKWEPLFIGVGAIGLAGLLLSHAMIFVIFSFPIFLYLVFSLLLTKEKLEFLKRVFLTFILGIGISAYYTFPALLEKKNTYFSQFFKSIFADHFVALSQLLYSKWGYGFSFPGTVNDQMAFQIGIAQWLSVFFAFLFVLYLLRKRGLKEKILEAFFFLFLFVFSIFMMVDKSKFLWTFLAANFPLDFPWRYLSLSVFSSSVLAGFVTRISKKNYLLPIILILLALYGNRNHLKVNLYTFYPESFYMEKRDTTNMFDEYMPKWVKKNEIKERKERVEILRGEMDIKIEKSKSNYLSFSTRVAKKGKVRIKTAYFPGWVMFVDGRKSRFDYQTSGFPEISLSPGDHKIVLEFKETVFRKICDFISLLSFVILALLLGKEVKRRLKWLKFQSPSLLLTRRKTLRDV